MNIVLTIDAKQMNVKISEWTPLKDRKGLECIIGEKHILSIYPEFIGEKVHWLIELRNGNGELKDITGLSDKDYGKKNHEIFKQAKAMSKKSIE